MAWRVLFPSSLDEIRLEENVPNGETSRAGDLLRARAAAAEAIAVAGAAETLFERFGQQLLAPAARESLRNAAVESTRQALQQSAPGLLSLAAADGLAAGTRQLAYEGTKDVMTSLPRKAVKGAAREIMKGVGRAAGVGFVIDGVIGGAEAVYGYAQGNITGEKACLHVLKEAGTGAAATAAGVGMAAGLVILTGGMAAPLLVLVAVCGSVATKLGLKSLIG
jgi:hypothetical protein